MSEPHHEQDPGISHAHVEGGAICIEDLSFHYPDGTPALEGIHLHVARGVTLAIVGPNGAGKTTLLKILLGQLGGYTGRVLVEGMTPAEARRRGVAAWVPQRSRLNTAFPITVRGLARLGLVGKAGLLRRYGRGDLRYLEHVLDVLGLLGIADRPIGRISGGQLQRTLIARALAPRPKLLLLDEPMVGVDAAGQGRFHELLASIRAEFGVTLVLVSHDIRAALVESQRIACLDRTLHFHDIPQRLSAEILRRVFHYEVEALPGAGPGSAPAEDGEP